VELSSVVFDQRVCKLLEIEVLLQFYNNFFNVPIVKIRNFKRGVNKMAHLDGRRRFYPVLESVSELDLVVNQNAHHLIILSRYDNREAIILNSDHNYMFSEVVNNFLNPGLVIQFEAGFQTLLQKRLNYIADARFIQLSDGLVLDEGQKRIVGIFHR
jgi:hypothetical protein